MGEFWCCCSCFGYSTKSERLFNSRITNRSTSAEMLGKNKAKDKHHSFLSNMIFYYTCCIYMYMKKKQYWSNSVLWMLLLKCWQKVIQVVKALGPPTPWPEPLSSVAPKISCRSNNFRFNFSLQNMHVIFLSTSCFGYEPIHLITAGELCLSAVA